MTAAVLPLAGVKVLDATRVLAGPYCTYVLALLGATVLRVERPGGDTIRWRTRANRRLGEAGLATDYVAQGSNKDIVYLDLAEPAGRSAFLEHLAASDVLVENFRTGALARLGLGDDAIRAARPGLVRCSITGYGNAGPRAGYPAYDSVIQAASGLMQLTGDARSGPLKAGAPLLDYATGMNAALGVLGALMHRRTSAEAMQVEVSMLDSALALMQSTVTGHLNGNESLQGRGNAASSGNPLSRDYDARDGRVCIAVNEAHQLDALLGALGMGEVPRDAGLAPRVQEKIRNWNVAELDAALNAAGVPCAPIQGLDRAVEMAVAADPGFVRVAGAAEPLRVLGLPFRLNGGRGETPVAPPPLGPRA